MIPWLTSCLFNFESLNSQFWPPNGHFYKFRQAQWIPWMQFTLEAKFLTISKRILDIYFRIIIYDT